MSRRARRNYAAPRSSRTPRLHIDRSVEDLSQGELVRGLRAYSRWHWSEDAKKVVDWNEPDMPRLLIECGRLARLHVRPVPSPDAALHPRRNRDKRIQLPLAATMQSHVAYDDAHPDQRLYFLVTPSARGMLHQRYWAENHMAPINLRQLARLAGGRHVTDFPSIAVKPIGALTGVVYFTHKTGDGPSYYLHKMGEVTGGFPILAIDNGGRLWAAGGSYTAPTPGISD